jgi:hypothetical protein
VSVGIFMQGTVGGSDCGPIGGHTVCGGGPRTETAGINSRTSSEAHYCVSGVRLFSLILYKSCFHALLRCKII